MRKPRIHTETVLALVLGIAAGAAAIVWSDSGDSASTSTSVPGSSASTPTEWAKQYCESAVDVYTQGAPSLVRLIAAGQSAEEAGESTGQAPLAYPNEAQSYTALVSEEFAKIRVPELGDTEMAKYETWYADNQVAIANYSDALDSLINGDVADDIDSALDVALPYAGGSAVFNRIEPFDVQAGLSADRIIAALAGSPPLPAALRTALESAEANTCQSAFIFTAFVLQ